MKIAIYSPYLDTYGGGERYVLSIAEYLSKNHKVDLLFDKHLMSLGQDILKKKLSEQLSLNLEDVNVIQAPLGKGSRISDRLFFLSSYDYLFYLTDGSIFYSTAKNSFLHFQVPFKNIAAKGLWGKIKLGSFRKAIYNSRFTKEIIEKTWPINGEVIYPPVDIEAFRGWEKQQIILSVGRFFDFLHSKKQEVLVEAFIKMVGSGLKGWKLVLAGGTNQAGQEYLKKIQDMSKGFPVEINPDVTFSKLQELYGVAKIYWHAAGYEEADPAKMEHFGITTVEAMAAGCVPVVINKGGLVEIVEDKKSGFLWETKDQLIEQTNKLINQKSLITKISKGARERSKLFSKDIFCQEIERLIDGGS